MSAERDDVIEYSLYNHHSEEEGKKLRKKIWMVTLILSVVTLVEVLLGANIKQDSSPWLTVKTLFIILTVVKAAYIVLSFMHLGDERKNLRWIVLGTYFIFIFYMVFIFAYEGYSCGIRM